MRDGIEVRHDCDTCISSVKTDRKTSFLEITTYINEDFGDYECRVRNKYGSTKMKISLRKIGKKINIRLLKILRPEDSHSGTQDLLKCQKQNVP